MGPGRIPFSSASSRPNGSRKLLRLFSADVVFGEVRPVAFERSNMRASIFFHSIALCAQKGTDLVILEG
jgi:hypothetical protein